MTLGRIMRPHGLAGAVRILPVENSAEQMLALLPECVLARPPRSGPVRTLTIARAQVHKGQVLAEFVEIAAIAEAEHLRGWEIVIPAANRPRLPADAWYADQLVGLTVLDAVSGRPVGVVREIISGAPQELLLIEKWEGGRLVLPFTPALVGDVDLAAGTLLATVLEGLDELGF